MIGEGDSEKRPPYHGLVNVDSPGHHGIRDEESVAYTFQNDVVVVFSECGSVYLLAR